MKVIRILFVFILLTACKDSTVEKTQEVEKDTLSEKSVQDTLEEKTIEKSDDKEKTEVDSISFTIEMAENLAKLPLDCIQVEYPNKLDHVISSSSNLQEPKELHPAFYGCFDWHSSVHGHWALIRLLKEFSELSQAEEIKEKLLENISKQNIAKEVYYFSTTEHKNSERPYGWAWLLKLAEEIHTWDDEIAQTLENNLQPLTDLMVNNFKEFLPKLTKPIRVGEHQNTAFALVFVYDYAESVNNKDLKDLVKF